MSKPSQDCAYFASKRVIAFACAVEPLALSVFWPPQLAGAPPVEAPPAPGVLLSLPQADSTSALAATRLSAAACRLIFTWILQVGQTSGSRRRPPLSADARCRGWTHAPVEVN